MDPGTINRLGLDVDPVLLHVPDGETLQGWVVYPDAEHASGRWILFFHGNAGNGKWLFRNRKLTIDGPIRSLTFRNDATFNTLRGLDIEINTSIAPFPKVIPRR